MQQPAFDFGDELDDAANPTYTVSELADAVNQQLRRGFSDGVWVRGEIREWNERGGHAYFSLADDTPGRNAVVRVQLFANARMRLRPPDPSPPERWIATSMTSFPTFPATRARSRPQRISSPSELVRCDRPQPSSAIASSRLVLPAALGPQIRWGPGPKTASTDA